MTVLNDIYEFGKAHWGVLCMGVAMIVRDWGTVQGWIGLKYFFFHGKLPPKQ